MVILLMPLNWGLESRKWQLATRDLMPLSFGRACMATLAGVAIGSFTFNRMGEYLGRMLFVDRGKQAQSVSLTLVCSLAQLSTTALMGCMGIFLLRQEMQVIRPDHAALFFSWLRVFAVISAAACAGLLVGYFRLSYLVSLAKMMHGEKIGRIVKVLQEVAWTTLFRILFLSFGRYFVFILQYYLLFAVFGLDLTWEQTWAAMSVMFLVIAVVPTFTFLTDLGLRWAASVQIISLFSSNAAGILAVSLGIWLINLIIPALLGSFLILRTKTFGYK